MKYLVTGSAGFIGFNVCKKLLAEGNFVIGIDNHNLDYEVSIKETRTQQLKLFDKFQFIKLDITNDGIFAILKNTHVDYVIHLAAKDNFYDSDKYISYSPYLTTNVMGTAKIFELAKQLGAKKFIFGSTQSIYGITKKGLLSEKKLLPKPISPHGASKLAAEEAVHFMSNFYGLPAVILRIFSVYGPGMRPHSLIPLLIDRISNDRPIDLYHDVDSTRDYLYVDDVVDTILAVPNKRIKFQIINVATGTQFTIKEMAQKIAKILGKDPELLKFSSHEKDFRKLVIKHAKPDIYRANKIIKCFPKVTIDKGLETTVKWYLENPAILHHSTHH